MEVNRKLAEQESTGSMARLFRLWMLAVLVTSTDGAFGDGESRFPTYQRSGSGTRHGGMYHNGTPQEHYPGYKHHGKGYRHPGHGFHRPQVSGSYFQRPYPYHLDYYRMRWGGSYAPYFGNLYGPPNVVLGVPYFGGGFYDGYGGVPFHDPFGAGPFPVPHAGFPMEAPAVESPPAGTP